MPKYKYQRLEDPSSIRVLELLPAEAREAKLRCNIIHITYQGRKDNDNIPYEALSYVWGDRVGTRPIMCGRQFIVITPSCEAALRRLRKRRTSRILWIDSICIDQSMEAVHERNHQVQLMGDIYSRAQRVLVWLGSGPDISLAEFERTQSTISVASQLGNWRSKVKILRPGTKSTLFDIPSHDYDGEDTNST